MDNKLLALYTIALIGIVVLLTSVNTLSIPRSSTANDRRRPEEDDGGGQGSDDPDHWRQQELASLREKIMLSLGLTDTPEPNAKNNITPEEMEDAFQMYHKEVEETERRKRQARETPMQEKSIVYTYNDQGVSPPSDIPPQANNLTSTWLYFPINGLANLSSERTSDDFMVATLRLHRSVSPEVPVSPEFHLYLVDRYGGRELADSQPLVALPQDDNGALLWDVTELASRWMRTAGENRGMLLACTHCDKLSHWVEMTLTRPQLLVRLRDSRGRTKRAAGNKNKLDYYTPRQGTANCNSTSEKRCCRKPLNISMVDLGLQDYIRMPSYIDIGYCKGKCPHNYNQASTHANIQSYLAMSKKATRHKKLPKLCCAPSKLGSIQIIIKKNGTQVHKTVTWENVIVEQCACS